MRYLIELGAHPTEIPPAFDDLTDAIQEELEKLGTVIDPDLLVNLRTGEVLAAMEVEADDMLAANIIATSALRAALHAVGGCTPGWDQDQLLGKFSTKNESASLIDA